MTDLSEVEKTRKWTQYIEKILRIFLGVEKSQELLKKGSFTVFGWVVYSCSDYLLVAFAATLVGWLRYNEWPVYKIFLILWSGNILISSLIVWANNRLQVDFTFCEGYSRLAMKIAKDSRMFWYTAAIPLIALTLWYGPGQLIIFLQANHQISKFLLGSILLVSAGLQMILWTWVYVIGYESLYQLIT